MTCASCAAKIEKRLNAIDGVTATVNYATDKAAVTYDPDAVTPAELCDAVASLGYEAHLPAPPPSTTRHHERARRRRRPRPHRAGRAGAPAAGDHRRARHPGDRAVDDPGAAVRRVDVAGVRARLARRGVGRVAVPPGHVGEPPPRRHHHGHAHQHRRARRLRVVGVRAVLGRGRGDRHDDGDGRHRRRHRRALPRGGRRGDHVPRRRALPRGEGQAALGRRPRRAPVPRGQGRGDPRRLGRAPRADRRAAPGHAVRRPPRRADRHRRRRRGRHLGGRRLDAHRRVRARRGRAGRRGHRAPPSTPAAGWSCAPRASAPTPRWPASRGWSRRPSPARPTCSGWPIGSRRSSCRSCSCWPPPRSRAGSLTGHPADGRLHRGGRRADHRLPVRARAGHADRAARRHRPRRPARRAHPGPGGARGAPRTSTRSSSTRPAP